MAEKFEYTREWTDANAFPRLGFTQSWENPEDYPTIETDETQVRKDMQSLHDEVKNYINTKLIPAILAEDATEEARASAEAARETAEQARASAEAARETAEQARVEAENGRVSAEAARVTAEQERAAAEQARADENTGIVARATAQAEAAEAAKKSAESAATSALSYKSAAYSSAVLAGQERGAAEQAKINAEAAQGKAEAAKEASEAAKAAAESAKDAAIQAQISAESADASAQSSAGAASAHRTAAEAAKEAAENAKGSAKDSAALAMGYAIGTVSNPFEFSVPANGSEDYVVLADPDSPAIVEDGKKYRITVNREIAYATASGGSISALGVTITAGSSSYHVGNQNGYDITGSFGEAATQTIGKSAAEYADEASRAAELASGAETTATEQAALARASETAAKASETAAAASADAAAASAARAEEVVGGDYATKTDLSAHTGNTDVHVTAAEKAAWNAKADAPFKPAGKSYLTFSSPNSFTLKVYDATKHWDGTLEYFASDKTWTTWDGTTTLSAVDNYGEYVLYLRGTGNTAITGNSPNYKWVLTGTDIACIGNIENLLDYATVEAGNHPTMASYCYRYMFYGCTGLTQAPALPATTMAVSCYSGMFQNCTSLTQAPALPATTLAGNCYIYMFRGCTSLTQAPALPATTLADNCYEGMFYGCTSLTQEPAMPATTLAVSCYAYMFRDCTNLTQAPALPATTLADNCYESMFHGCTSLTQAPSLPAATLVNRCYYNMFYGCTSLKLSATQTGEYAQEYRIPTTDTGITATNALTYMFTSTGGTFTGTPEINTTYYLSSDNMVVRETEIATLNGYVGSMIDAAGPKTAAVTLTASGWDSTAKTQTVTVTGVSATETAQLITPVPALASQTSYYDAGIKCTGQAANSLTFTADTVPTADLTVYVTIQEVSA